VKVLQLIHTTQLRGAEVFASQLSEHLHQQGVEVSILSLYDGPNAALPTRLNIGCLSAKSSFDFTTMKKLSKIIKENKVDIVQANAGDTLQFAALSKMFFNWKSKLIFRNASTMSRYVHSLQKKLFYRFLFRAVDHIVSVSKSSAEDLCRLFPGTAKKISVVPIGIESPGNILKQRNNEAPVILHVGGFSFEKNHTGLINIFSEVLRQFPTAKLWLVGDGALKNKVEAFAKEKNIFHNIDFLGSRTDVHELMQRSNLFVLPSIIEGLPAVILEAMAVSLPVVAYNVGGIHEVISDETGYLIPAGDEHAFVNAILSNLNNTENTARAKKAKLLVDNEFMNTQISRRFIDIYETVLSDARQFKTAAITT
jgi:glycosyltransferase involved in cell wall biosynthesis